MHYWLMKTEPTSYSIDNLEKQGFTAWEGVRNFQARNYLRQMKKGDLGLFYHSATKIPGVAGICRIIKEDFPDHTQWEPKSKYYDPKATLERPIWFMVEVEYVERFPHFVSLEEIKRTDGLQSMKLLQKGSRLSVMPIEESHFKVIKALGHTEANW